MAMLTQTAKITSVTKSSLALPGRKNLRESRLNLEKEHRLTIKSLGKNNEKKIKAILFDKNVKKIQTYHPIENYSIEVYNFVLMPN